MDPRLERVTAVHGDLLHPQPLDARVVDRIAARGTLQLRRRRLQTGGCGSGQGAFERRGAAAVVDRRSISRL
jgi:hypothetical protein